MGNPFKKIIKKIPGIKSILNKNCELINELEYSRHQAVKVGQELVDSRLELKKIKKEKINVVFVCHRPAVWESLNSIYEELKSDNSFSVTIVAIPNKKELPKLGLNHEIYESEGAEDFWKSYGCINGFNYETKQWLDLRSLNPDYVFFQQPYNITRCEQYKSWNVGQYAKICYVPYAFDFIGNGVLEECSPKDFICDLSLYFTQNEIDDKLVKKILNDFNATATKTVITGFPRYDNLDLYRKVDAESWKFAKSNSFRILWTPRWCTNEGNCHFFEYKDLLVKYAQNNDDVSFLFRPHPQAFKNWNSTGELSNDEAKKYIAKYNSSNNMRIDNNRTYFETIFQSDCLISDTSSFIADYFLTGKPIIYCHKVDMFNDVSKKMSEGFYWVHNWDELKDILDKLKSGIDPLKEKREQLIKELFENSNKACKIIKDIIKG